MMKSFKEIGVPSERILLGLAGGNHVADCPAVLRAGDAAFERCSRHLPNCVASSCFLAFGLSCLALLSFAGCSSAKPKLGSISVTDPASGAVVSSVIVNATASVSVPVGSDGPNLGIDWSLECGGSPNTILESTNVCGALNPVHVGSSIAMLYTAPAYVPIGNTVTLTATSTTDPAVSARVILAITQQPVTMAWSAGDLPPTQIAAGGSPSLAASVSNDPMAAGISWSATCGSSACGSFNPTVTASGAITVYSVPTAIPSGSAVGVTVSATSIYDKSKSISAAISIMPVAVTVTTSPSIVGANGGTATLTATVAWDASGAGVAWSSPSCGASDCGSIASGTCAPGAATPSYSTICIATYTAPVSLPNNAATLPVTVTAASNADPTKSGIATITVGPPPPIAVIVAGPSGLSPMAVQVNGTILLTATVTNDSSNNGAGSGVSWSCSPGSCTPASSISSPFTTTYTAPSAIPSINPVTVTASSSFCSQNPGSSQCIGNSAAAGSTTITIVPAISVTITPPASITAGRSATFSATVTGDESNAGLDWTASCFGGSPDCGTIVPSHSASGASVSYTAATSLPWVDSPMVIVAATSTASETVPPLFPALGAMPGSGVSDPVQVAVTPVPYVSFVPYPPSSLPVTNLNSPTMVNLIAVSSNDATNAGVDWSVCSDPSTCGEFLKMPGAPATTTSLAVPPVYSPTLHGASGQAVSYLPPSSMPSGGTVTIQVASTTNSTVGTSQAIAITNSFAGVALTGKVMAGNQPISGASVQLYQAGSAGYGSAATPVTFSNGANSVASAGDGSFTIPAGYTCTSVSSTGTTQFGLLYLVATGGTPGGKGSPNGQLGLMAALGPCSSLNSSVPLVVNEVTTVATAWALAPFTGEGGGGFQSYKFIGSSSANYNNGLANAFATVNNLVDITVGQALDFTPGGGTLTPPDGSEIYNGLVPYAEINTLADAIDTCAVTAGGQPGDGSACDAFFYASNVNPSNSSPPGGIATHSNEPTTILAAVLEVAQYPYRSSFSDSDYPQTGSAIFDLVFTPVNPSWTPPFSPILPAAPTDWTIALSFTGGGLEGAKAAQPDAAAMAIDATGNLWVANSSLLSVTELSNLGVALSPYASGHTRKTAGGFTGGGITYPGQIAVDPYGSVWILNNNSSLSELDSTGAPVVCSGSAPDPFCGGSALSSPFAGAGNPNNTAVGLAIDGTGNVWVADSDTSATQGDVAKYAGFKGGLVNGKQVSNGATLSASGVGYSDLTVISDPLDTQPASPSQAIGVDGNGNIWFLDQANYAAVELGNNGSLKLIDHGYQQTDPVTGNPISPALGYNQWGNTLAIDSAGDAFIPDITDSGGQFYELYAPGSNLVGTGQIIDYPSEIVPGVFSPIALDGASRLWMMTQASSSQPPALAEFSASGSILNLNTGLSGSNYKFGYVGPGTGNSPVSIAVDASGNVWLLLSSTGIVTLPSGASATVGQVVEFVGVATPVVTPMSLGKLGAKP